MRTTERLSEIAELRLFQRHVLLLVTSRPVRDAKTVASTAIQGAGCFDDCARTSFASCPSGVAAGAVEILRLACLGENCCARCC